MSIKKDKKIINIKIEFFKSILDKIELTLSPKKLTVLVGKNGVGKSNILKAISSHNKMEENWEPKITRNKEEFSDRELIISIESMYTLWITRNVERDVFKRRYVNYKFIVDSVKNAGFSTIPPGRSANWYPISRLVNNWKVRKDEIEKKEIFLNNLKEEVTNFKTEYIKNSEQLSTFKYSYDLSSDFFDAEESGESKDRNLSMIINFFQSINPNKDVENMIKDYINHLDDSDDSDDSEEELNNRMFEINDILEQSLSSFFKRNFNDVFDFQLKAILNKRKLIFEISHSKNYLFESKKIEESSSGIKSILYLIIRIESLIYLSKNSGHDTRLLILLDEPEKNLFPELQSKLVKYFSSILKNNDNIYILITTHHMSMIPTIDFTLNIIERNNEGKTKNDVSYGSCSFIDSKCDDISENKIIYPIIKSIIDSNKEWEKIFKK